ncbi:MAG TPA: hypothetical protein VMV05_11965 [bacterium]|nr:hypothetical protein [bacterium]
MATTKSLSPLGDIYQQAWESCSDLWPLFVLRFIFMLLNIGAMILCLILVFGSLILSLFKGLQDMRPNDVQDYFKNFDFSGFAHDPGWLVSAVGIFALYMIWWLLLENLFNAGLYRRLWDRQKNGADFNLRQFFVDGIQYFLPMLGLYLLLIFSFFFVMFCLFVGAIAFGILFKAMGIIWLGILLMIPGFFLFLLLMATLAATWYMANAYVMEGFGVMDSFRRAFLKCKENTGRVLWGILVVFIGYFILSFSFQLIMGLFSHVPLIGALFLLFEMFVNFVLAVMIWVFIPAVAVTFLLEKEA